MKLKILTPFKSIKKILLDFFLIWVSKSSIGPYLFNEFAKNIFNQFKIAIYDDIKLKFVAPNPLNIYRINTFDKKEPETLEWIRAIPLNSILWDVGANIGLYSIYAAKARQSRVYAFEPSVFNLEVLARNIDMNGLQNNICIMPIALNNKLNFNMFKMSNTEWGGALSTFEYNINQDGEPLKKVFEYQTLGMPIDYVCSALKVPFPEYLKIDVDGIEHLILQGGMKTLLSVNSVLIEINDDFKYQAQESAAILQGAGLILYKKCYLGNNNQYNQWWVRSLRNYT
jgi:FkbM family methyltransferase